MKAPASRPDPARESTDPAAPLPVERWLLLLLLGGLVLWWLALPEAFHLPNNDYYSFERSARSFAAFELPDSFKRMPVFPALMALTAPFVPGDQAWLGAARLLNAAFSLGLLALLYALAARSIGRGAILPVALLALNPAFQSMALQPLVEPSMGFFVILAFWLFSRRSDWMYVAAAIAALSRYEVGVIVPALVLAGMLRDRAWRRHLLLGAQASAPVLLWALLSRSYSQDGIGNYLELMQAGSFKPELRFLHSSLKQPFEGWYRGPDDQLHWFLLAVGLPIAAGLRSAWRRFPWLSLSLILFYLAAVGLVMAFGIDKARYVYPSQWILLFFFALGCREIALDGLPRWLARYPRPAAGLALLAAIGLGLRMAWIWWEKLSKVQSDVPLALELALLGLALAILVACSLSLARGRGLPGLAGAALLLAVCLPVLAGGVTLSRYELNKVRYYNWELWLLGDWIEAALPPDARIVVMHPSHIKFLTGLGDERVSSFGDFEAPVDDLEAFRQEMARRGFDYVAYTFRAPPKDASGEFYYDANKFALAERFAGGEPVAGFEKAASLPVPDWLEHSDVQIYRRAP